MKSNTRWTLAPSTRAPRSSRRPKRFFALNSKGTRGADAAASRRGRGGRVISLDGVDSTRRRAAYKESIASAGEDVAARGEAELAYAAFLAQQWALARADAKTRDGRALP